MLAFVPILTLLLCAPRVGMGIGMAIGVRMAFAPSCGGGCGVSGPCVWLPGIPKSAQKTESSPHAKEARFAPHAIEGMRDGRPPLLLPAIPLHAPPLYGPLIQVLWLKATSAAARKASLI